MGVNITLGKLKRFMLVTLGLICLTLGIIGYVIPGLPGTIWLILAATFFVRSSERLYNLVVQNRFFGRQVREFLERAGPVFSDSRLAFEGARRFCMADQPKRCPVLHRAPGI